ncbi:citrate lyase acyl carrier protein [Proteiniclasticum sp. BAD-10]|uniref:Citrate lyase acyl carrier protein n=1 Tax=Proteiniclasticum sediminis TaxID=2804028 RepID=A0A941CQE6_9CLOT|nr:citrate lyase acyl carrier protein [Proteiniclasticum sediminis]
MKLNHPSMAGTLESSDIQILLSPADQGIELNLESSVLSQYGLQIRQTILDVLEKLEVTDAKVVAIDKGALDCTIRSRVQTAVFRAVDQTENLPWGVSM